MTGRELGDGAAGRGEVLFECRRVGSVLRVAAIDPATNTEVVVAGPVEAGEAALQALARRKLARALAAGSGARR